MAVAKFEPTFEIVFNKMGLTHLIRRICSFLDFEDGLTLLYSYPELLETSKYAIHACTDAPNESDLEFVFEMVDFAKMNQDQLATKIFKAKNVAAFRFIRSFFGNGIYDSDLIWQLDLCLLSPFAPQCKSVVQCEKDEKIIGDFMEKVIEENDFDTFVFILLQKFWLKDNWRHSLVLEIDHRGSRKASNLNRQDMFIVL